MNKIIFKNEDNSIGIITPTADTIPTDRTFRSAWELPEDTVFEGTGSTSNEFKEIK